jgi:hypothetical protein
MNLTRTILLWLAFSASVRLLGNQATATVPLPEHPRPDFERAEWANLNGEWQFRFDR